jgi:hypothetical protein
MAPLSPRDVAEWAAGFQEDLAKHLAQREKSTHRVITLEESYKKLRVLSLKQDELMREALQCVEAGFYRPAHVTAWAATIDFCHEWATVPKRLAKIQAVRAKWVVATQEDFHDQTDFAFFEAVKAAGLIPKSVMKGFHGLLNKRNECAHPEEYKPTINDTLGYVDELMKRISALQAKVP